jgi:hypothetical protein
MGKKVGDGRAKSTLGDGVGVFNHEWARMEESETEFLTTKHTKYTKGGDWMRRRSFLTTDYTDGHGCRRTGSEFLSQSRAGARPTEVTESEGGDRSG